jgi:hypothetical protein
VKAPAKTKNRNHNGDKELDDANSSALGDPKQDAAERFQQRSGFGQCGLEIGRSQIPKLINRIADDWPGFTAWGGGGSIKADGSR